jgi:O-antigen/teichoic acid export membrane protein
VLRADFIGPSQDLIPIFTIAFAFMTMRNFYFAQVIYFIHASYLELIVSTLFLIVSTTLSLLLVPTYGAHGAAISLMVASIVSCLAFMVIGRRWYSLPIDLTGLGSIASLATIFVFGARSIQAYVASANILLMIDLVVFVLFSAFAVVRFGLLSSASDAVEQVAVDQRVTSTVTR